MYKKKAHEKYKNTNNIFRHDAIYDNQYLSKMRFDSKAYVHGHQADGTNPSLVEILFFEKGINAFDCSSYRAT